LQATENTNFIYRILDATYQFYFSADGRLYWPYLLATLVIALVLYFVLRPRQLPLSFQAVRDYIFPARIYKHKSTQVDAVYFLVNSLSWIIIAVPFALLGFSLADLISTGLTNWLGVYPIPFRNSNAFIVCFIIVLVIAGDLGFYLAHRIMHRVGFLWEFHKVHHSAEVLNPLTLFREHPVDKIVNSLFFGLALGMVLGVFEYLNGSQINVDRFSWVEGLVFFLAGGHFRHMEIWISYGKIINHLVISPAHHLVHHSNDTRHLDKNFGGFLAIWDWWFKSLYLPDKTQKLALGLTNNEHKKFNSVWKLYYLPFVNLYSRIARRK